MNKTAAVACVTLMVIATPLLAQVSPTIELTVEVLDEERDAIIANALDLTKEEEETFRTVYESYRAKQLELRKRYRALITEFTKNYGTLTDEQADKIMTEWLQLDRETLELETKYYEKFRSVLPAKKAARLFQVENKLRSIVDAQLAKEIPLIP